ncbi:Tumor necrosis factor ligand superfamily member 14 [Nibea albiflora]|uniref:Tumor necrosis factor ligand superfamily member 14 n=1 Tax=Nibea albiflora TaxID=240163 RepID=A0ACB7FM55_NIBAL|nr:Tumor necrosis factor ligand superfamily member 14 [Nibea albiflora]
MAEGGVVSCPQVFVVDTQANYVSVPSGKTPRWARVGQKCLLLLVGLTMLGLVVEGYLIYHLYKKNEAFSLCMSHSLCQNLSNPKTSGQQDGTRLMSLVGSKGSGSPAGENNVVQWQHENGDAITSNMGYNKGRLLVERKGHYYLYSKVTINAVEECSLIQHKVMKDTKAYDKPIELMKSKSFRCRTPKPSSANSKSSSDGDDLWNSFLAGIFNLETGDEIFVIVDNINKMRPGTTENLMGAFMIFP